jgi:endogenous inhibitor of DNA gyrase (YacG/DUF329 family)
MEEEWSVNCPQCGTEVKGSIKELVSCGVAKKLCPQCGTEVEMKPYQYHEAEVCGLGPDHLTKEELDRLNPLLGKLGLQIPASILGNPKVRAALKEIQDLGYHVQMQVGAGMLLNRISEEDAPLSPMARDGEFLPDASTRVDNDFLKGLRINLSGGE